MPSWKKVILSGSNAALNSLTVSNGITGSLYGTSSWAVSSSYALTSSYSLNPTISGSISLVDYINFNTASAYTLAEGKLGWDNGEGGLQLGMAGGNVQYALGEQLMQYCYNTESTPLTIGQVVLISGSQGNKIAVKLADNSGDPSSAGTLGFVAETITAGGNGWIITEGNLRKINTVGLNPGALLYLGSTPGTYTQTLPQAPLHTVRLGYVERVHATVGSIYVKIDNGYELGELHDVVDTTTTSSYGDLLVKSGSVWINSRQLTGSYGLTGSLQATSFTGSLFGTASFASTSSFLNSTTNAFIQNGNSFGTTALLGTNDNQSLALETSGSTRMFISSSGNVGIGATTPSASLHVRSATTSSLSSSFYVENQTATASFVVKDNGAIGAGIATPVHRFQVNTPAGTDAFAVTNGANFIKLSTNIGSGNPGIQSSGVLHIQTPINGTGGNEILQVRKAGSANFIQYWSSNAGVTLSAVDGTGRLGIGTGTTPLSASLHIKGATSSSLSSSLLVQNLNASASFTVLDNGNVGIGTTTPSASLDVVGGNVLINYQSNYGSRNSINNIVPVIVIGTGSMSGVSQSNLYRAGYVNTNGFEIGTPAAVGIYGIDSDGTNVKTFGIYTNNVRRLTIDSSGSLRVSGSTSITGSLTVTQGITGSLFGTSSWAVSASWAPAPTDAFVQNGNSFGTTALLGTNDNNSLALETSGSTRMFISSSGNIGIGTTTPQRKLDVLSGANNFVSVGIDQIAVGQWAGVHFGYAEGANNLYRKSAIIFERTDLTSNNAQGKVHILNGPQGNANSATLADSKLTINEAGNVGIGTTTPSQLLEVNGNALIKTAFIGTISAFGDNYTSFSHISRTGSGDYSLLSDNAGATYLNAKPNQNIRFRIDNTDKAILSSSGDFGIGTTSPGAKLEVASAASGTTLLVGRATGNSSIKALSDGGGYLALDSTGAPLILNHYSTDSVWMVTGGGNVGINTTTPNAKLDVNGNVIITGSLTVTGRITAEEFHTEFVSSSIIYLSGSTKFGDSSDDVMSVTGSLRVEGSITGSLLGTASYATQALSASWAPAATTAATASFVTSSNVYGPNGSNSILSASFAISSSYVVSSSNALTASYILNAQSSSVANAVRISDSNTTGTTQYVGFVGAQSGTSTLFTDIDLTYVPSTNTLNATSSRAVSSSYAVSASNALTASFVVSSSYAVSASSAVSSSRAVSSSYAVSASNALTASSVSGIGGTTNYLAKFTGATTLSSSAIYDTGTNVMIGTTSPGGRFTVTPNGTGTGINGTAIYAYSNGGPTIDAGAANSSSIVATNNSINSSTLVAQNIGSGPIFSLKNNTDAVVVHVLNNGRVGLGNITPNANLDVSGSAIITGSLRVLAGITGSLFGTSSWAVSASWAPAATTAATASFVTSSNVFGPNGSNSILSASFAISSSRTVSSSYAISSSNALTASFIVSSSYAISSSNATTASYALTASFLNGGTTNAFIQNGNSFGTTALLGTNDNQPLAFETNGTTAMFISSSGNVGIGTTSPSTALHIARTAAVSPTIRLQTTDSTTNGAIQWTNSTNTMLAFIGSNSNVGDGSGNLEFATGGSTTRMIISSSGNVGIGTTNPGAKLDVAGALGGTVGIGGSTIRLINTDTSNAASITAGITGIQNEGMQFATDGAVKMVIASSKVGINTTAPTHRFTSNVSSMSPSGDQDYPIFASVAGKGVVLGYDTSNDISIINGVHTAVAWKGIALATVGGNVGIGTVTPGYKLDVNGNTNVNGTLTATVKSFIIDHPTKEGKKLQYGVLEGPEHSVYVRGKLKNNNTITLPDHWTGLIHEDTITVNLTPIGKRQDLWVETVTDTAITVGSDNEINCFYTVFAERKDIEKLVTEFDK